MDIYGTMTTKLFSSYYNNIKNQYIYMNNMPKKNLYKFS